MKAYQVIQLHSHFFIEYTSTEYAFRSLIISKALEEPYVYQVREINFYKEGDLTHYNQKLDHVTLQGCWEECMERSDFSTRRQEVDKFNR